jgi:hypothetical protein
MATYKQTSFSGGLNLLLDDTRLPVSLKYKEGDSPYDISYNQYRIASNIRTRFDVCTPIESSIVQTDSPLGIKQAIVSFGNYIILFVAGECYYKLSGTTGWTPILSFSMSVTAPRYWTVAVPVTTTNYGRLAVTTSVTPTIAGGTTIGVNTPIVQTQSQANIVAGTYGTLPGLLVQDGINQPRFIYLDVNGNPQCATTQTYNQWNAVYGTASNNYGQLLVDQREYVPIGTFMEFYNGILFIVGLDGTSIYRSVSGRPLDFVVNVNTDGSKGGDATTTSYSVGVSGITAMRAMPGGALFVAAGGAGCFFVTLNQTPNAPTIFGEYTFNRQTLFTSSCMSERGIIDIAGAPNTTNSGDTVFIAVDGLRSFNAIQQLQNEGRNSVFSSTVQSLFTNIQQSSNLCAAVSFDNYAIFSVQTTLGYCLVVYDTVNSCYSSIDFAQLGNTGAKQFAAITINQLALYAITTDDRVVELFASPTSTDAAVIRLGSVSSQDPNKEHKVTNFRAIFSNITESFYVTAYLLTNNRLDQILTNHINYVAPVTPYAGPQVGTDVDTETENVLFTFTQAKQGWKSFIVLTWTGGASLNSTSIMAQDVAVPMQSVNTQAVANLPTTTVELSPT